MVAADRPAAAWNGRVYEGFAWAFSLKPDPLKKDTGYRRPNCNIRFWLRFTGCDRRQVLELTLVYDAPAAGDLNAVYHANEVGAVKAA